MKKIILKIIFWVILILIILGSVIIGLGYIKYREAINRISIGDKIKEIQRKDNYTKLSNISDNYEKAVIAIEDHRFYEHTGIDFFTLIRSTYVNIRRKSIDYGASTITQQVRKAYVFFTRKIIFKKNRRIVCCT